MAKTLKDYLLEGGIKGKIFVDLDSRQERDDKEKYYGKPYTVEDITKMLAGPHGVSIVVKYLHANGEYNLILTYHFNDLETTKEQLAQSKNPVSGLSITLYPIRG